MARASIRAPVVLPYRSSTAYNLRAQSPRGSEQTADGWFKDR
jgi:hypothetical protein